MNSESSLIQSLNWDLNSQDTKEIQSLIGTTEELTESILRRLASHPPNKAFLPLHALLLLEKFDSAVTLIAPVLEQTAEAVGFLNVMLGSRFFLQRMAVPVVLRNMKSIPSETRKTLLRSCLKDEICEVVKQAVSTIRENNPFTNEELLEIALDLFNSKYIKVKILSVEILAIVRESSFLLSDMITSKNWRIRLRVVSRFNEFNAEDQEKIFKELACDQVDEVRIELSKYAHDLGHNNFLEDPHESVRANYLSNIIDRIDDEAVFRKLIEDESWAVKKVLLNLKGEMFKKITIPLIKNSTQNVPWRIKNEILGFIEEKVSNEFVSKLLMGFLIKNMKDKVFEIRQKSQRILVKIIKMYEWVNEYYYEFEALTTSSNYLHRITAVPVAIEYDQKFGTDLGNSLKNDSVENVQDFVRDYIKERGLNVVYDIESPDPSYID